ncbi:MAG TPA: hypothetical protein VE031_01150 [Chthoniobacterales bacterium]|nr:hypothetical protein [Chthoniobacterales bacterium]
MRAAIVCQLVLLAYHQLTTLVDFFPFNGSRYYTRQEKLVEAGSNALLMSLGPIAFIFHLRGLMTFAVIYYFVLFAVEIIIWWIPYFTIPRGAWHQIYNRALARSTSNFETGDTLEHWRAVYDRLHANTTTFLPGRPGRIVPNVEHSILHAWTLVTAIVTAIAYARA